MVRKRRAIFLSIALSLGCCLQQMSGARGPMESAADSISAVTPEMTDSLRQQALVDSLMSKDLGEVTVEAQTRYMTPTFNVYLTSARQRNAAQNMIDLLQFMSIPQIHIDPRNQSVTDNFGREISLFINYLPATEEDKQGLRTADVRKVEYMEFPTDPRFKGAEKVLNFIVREYEYGGYTKFSTTQCGVKTYYSNNNIFSKFSYKKMTYDLYSEFRYFDDSHYGIQETSVYRLPDVQGAIHDVSRMEIPDNGLLRQKHLPVTFRATYNTDNIQVRNTIGYYLRSTPSLNSSGTLYNSAFMPRQGPYSSIESERSNNVSYTGDFNFILPKDFTLTASPKFSYTHNNIQSDYRNHISSPIMRTSKENGYSFEVELFLRKQFRQHHAVTLDVTHSQSFNRVQYLTPQSISKERFHRNSSDVTLGYQLGIEKLNLTARLGLVWDNDKVNNIHISDVAPFIHLSSKYAFDTKNSITFQGTYKTVNPGAAAKSEDIQQIHELLYLTGNPTLKNYRQLQLYLSYNWWPTNMLALSAFGSFDLSHNRPLPYYFPYEDGKALLRYSVNNGNFYQSTTGLSVTLNLLQGKLSIFLSPYMTFYKSTGLYRDGYNPVQLYGNVTYYLNQFYFQTYYNSPLNQMMLSSAINKSRSQYALKVGWGNGDWNINISAINLFNNGYLTGTSRLDTPLLSRELKNYDLSFSRKFSISVTYTIGYGKKLQRKDEVGEQQGTSSAILK